MQNVEASWIAVESETVNMIFVAYVSCLLTANDAEADDDHDSAPMETESDVAMIVQQMLSLCYHSAV